MRSYECNQECKLLHSFLHNKSSLKIRHGVSSSALYLHEWLDSSLAKYVVASDKSIQFTSKHFYNIHGTKELPCGSSLQAVAMNSLTLL